MADEAGQLISFPDKDGFVTVNVDELDPVERERLRLEAARRKAEHVHRVNGAQLRAALLPRKLLKEFADGTAVMLLAQLLHGEIKPRDAKEAADVAKVAYDIARREEANAPLAQVAKEAATDRPALEVTARTLLDELRARQREAAALPDAPFGDDPDDVDEWDHAEQVPAAPSADGYAPDGSEPSVGV